MNERITQPPASSKWLPWNHPLRADAEKLVQNYHDYAQSHLPSDQSRWLANEIVEFTQRHHAAAQAETVALLEETLPYLEIIREFPNDDGSSSGSLADEIRHHLAQLKEGAT